MKKLMVMFVLLSLLVFAVGGFAYANQQQGPQGPQGPQGIQGPQGPVGQDGVNGMGGINGKDGQNGDNGKNGTDATCSDDERNFAYGPGVDLTVWKNKKETVAVELQGKYDIPNEEGSAYAVVKISLWDMFKKKE